MAFESEGLNQVPDYTLIPKKQAEPLAHAGIYLSIDLPEWLYDSAVHSIKWRKRTPL